MTFDDDSDQTEPNNADPRGWGSRLNYKCNFTDSKKKQFARFLLLTGQITDRHGWPEARGDHGEETAGREKPKKCFRGGKTELIVFGLLPLYQHISSVCQSSDILSMQIVWSRNREVSKDLSWFVEEILSLMLGIILTRAHRCWIETKNSSCTLHRTSGWST